MDRHREPGRELPEGDEPVWFDDGDGFDQGDAEPLPRPVWWRWLAVVLVVAMVVATPFAYALYRILH